MTTCSSFLMESIIGRITGFSFIGSLLRKIRLLATLAWTLWNKTKANLMRVYLLAILERPGEMVGWAISDGSHLELYHNENLEGFKIHIPRVAKNNFSGLRIYNGSAVWFFSLAFIKTFLISLGNRSWETILVDSDIAICQCTSMDTGQPWNWE